jgi:hypothetical protein
VAKFKCVCGETIATSGPIPNPAEWRLLSDVDFDAFQGLVQAEDVYQAATIMYRCPASGHLWIYWQGFDQPPSLYAPQPSPPATEPT